MSWAEVKKINSNLDMPINQKMEDYFRSFKRLYKSEASITQFSNESDDNYITQIQQTFPNPVKLVGVYLVIGVEYSSLTNTFSLSGHWKLSVDGDQVFDSDYSCSISNTSTTSNRKYAGMCDIKYVEIPYTTSYFLGINSKNGVRLNPSIVGSPGSDDSIIAGFSDSYGSNINISIKRNALPSGLNNCQFTTTLVYEM